MNDLIALEDRILRFMGKTSDEDFICLLNGLVDYQRRWNPRLAAFWNHRGFTGHARSAHDVPAVPTDVFRHVRLCSSEGPVTRTFRTSGTTSGNRGESSRLSTRVYDHGALAHVRQTTLPRAGYHFVNLVLDPTAHPDSSLSHMVQIFNQQLGSAKASYYLTPDGVDVEAVASSIASAQGPTVVFGTAFAFAALIEAEPDLAPLPPHSLIIETGGFKGRSREFERPDLYRALGAVFSVVPEAIRSEYSMTELSSQLYSAPWCLEGEQRLIPPHWCEVSAADPDTLRPVSPGVEGLLRFVDLANADTVVAVQTSDLGVVHDDGTVSLRGRALGARPRGCSLAVEEILELQQHPNRFT